MKRRDFIKLVVGSGADMRRRDKAGRKAVKTQRPKTLTPRNAPKAARRRSAGAAEKSDYRHHGLLGARRERPSDRRAAEKRDEIAPPHCRPRAQEEVS